MKRFNITVLAMVFATAGPGLARAGDYTIGLSWDARESALNQAWEDFMKAETERLAKEEGHTIDWVVNMANNDSTRQAANIEDLINRGVDIVIARALDAAAIGSSIRRAEAASIPFVTFDRASSGRQPTAHTGGDSAYQARVASEELIKLFEANDVNGKCIEVLGSLADINAVNRTEEFAKAAEASDRLEIVAQIPSEWDPNKVLAGLNDSLPAHPEANCLLLASDWAITSVQSALETVDKWYPAGHDQHVWIASNDLLTAAIGAMEEGYIDVAVTWDAEAHAKEAVRVMMAILEGEDPGCGDDGCLAKGSLATPENVAAMTDYWARNY